MKYISYGREYEVKTTEQGISLFVEGRQIFYSDWPTPKNYALDWNPLSKDEEA